MWSQAALEMLWSVGATIHEMLTMSQVLFSKHNFISPPFSLHEAFSSPPFYRWKTEAEGDRCLTPDGTASKRRAGTLRGPGLAGRTLPLPAGARSWFCPPHVHGVQTYAAWLTGFMCIPRVLVPNPHQIIDWTLLHSRRLGLSLPRLWSFRSFHGISWVLTSALRSGSVQRTLFDCNI